MRLLPLAALIALLATSSIAQTYPTRPVQVIVPSSPGGISDTAARLVGERLTRIWGGNVVIDNRPGGGSSIGTGAASRATPDGYTLLVATYGEVALSPVVHPNLSYDPARDLHPLVIATYNPILVVADGDATYRTLADLMDAARKHPGTIPWASAGLGTWNHLAGEWLQLETGIKLIHTPFRGGAPAATAVAGGHVPVGLLSTSSVLPYLQSGQIRVLAVTSRSRTRFDVSWPTVAELTGAGVDAVNWVAFFAPKGLDRAISKRIQNSVVSVLEDPQMIRRLLDIGSEPGGTTSEALVEQIKVDRAVAERVGRDANMSVN